MNKKGNSPKRENCERDCRIILQLREELRLLREQLEESVKLHSEFVRSTDQEVIEKVMTHYLCQGDRCLTHFFVSWACPSGLFGLKNYHFLSFLGVYGKMLEIMLWDEKE